MSSNNTTFPTNRKAESSSYATDSKRPQQHGGLTQQQAIAAYRKRFRDAKHEQEVAQGLIDTARA